MTLEERISAYEICRQRGHSPSGEVLLMDPPLSVCKFCGTHYSFKTQLIESNVPLSPFTPAGRKA